MGAIDFGHDSPIIDIRQRGIEHSILDDFHQRLNPDKGQERQLSTMLLYDERGLQLFEDITHLEEYYLTNAEIDVLQTHATALAEHIAPNAMLVELGSGNLRKVKILLGAFEAAQKPISYYALDLSLPELERTLQAVPAYKHVQCHGLLGTYDDGLDWLQLPANAKRPKTILSMGSSIGNFPRKDAAQFLHSFKKVLTADDCMILGIDACQDPDRVYHAYNDTHGITHQFILNGLVHANRLLEKEVFQLSEWKVIGEYNVEAHRHQAFLLPLHDVDVLGTIIPAGERIRIEESYKYSTTQIKELWQHAGLQPQARYSNATGNFHLHVLKNSMAFELRPEDYAAAPLPTIEEYEQLWQVWDLVTCRMIPQQELNSKPIKLRNACIFYLGHIPAFLDMHITRATRGLPTSPAAYHDMFERGIDPDVDNPDQCHAHSEIPAEWPSVEALHLYRDRVRDRTRTLYQGCLGPQMQRALWLAFEHEAMHLETLLYMLVQSEKMLPPEGFPRPNFTALARQANEMAVPNKWIRIPEVNFMVGMDDFEDKQGTDCYFGWDNEKPRRQTSVKAFEAKARLLTNGDYALYLKSNATIAAPASWRISDMTSKDINTLQDAPRLTKEFLAGKAVRTVFGFIPLQDALHWPVMASYDELTACAVWYGGRIPTADETRAIYAQTELVQKGKTDKRNGAVNGHLTNGGIEISPPATSRSDLFADLQGCNVGFQQFTPSSITHFGNALSGRGQTGGVWEWTSSVLERHAGFVPGKLYPAYTADFFDGKHNIVLGGSWATHPRIAGRKSFVNWYQRNYPFAWCGARLVRDV